VVRNCVRWINKHRKQAACFALGLLLLALNGVAFMHAHAMTHFVVDGRRTPKPDKLSAVEKVKVLFTGVRVPKPVITDDPANHGLPFTNHRFAGPSDMEYEGWHIPCDHSRGLCILFHGYAGCKSSLLAEALAWQDLGYETFLVDFRGCGNSSGHTTTIGYHEADDVAAAFQYARRKLTQRPIVLYGQSMGAAAILRAVAFYDLQPRAVVLECPFDRMLSTAKNRFSVIGLPPFPFAHLLVFGGGVQHGFSGFGHNPVDYAEQVVCPVLLMSGERDTRVTKEQVTAVFNNIAGEKQLVFFPALGHESCLQERTGQSKRLISHFLHD